MQGEEDNLQQAKDSRAQQSDEILELALDQIRGEDGEDEKEIVLSGDEIIEKLFDIQQTTTDQYIMVVRELKQTVALIRDFIEKADTSNERLFEVISTMKDELNTNVVRILDSVVNMLSELTVLSGSISQKVDELAGTKDLGAPDEGDPLWTVGQKMIIDALAKIHSILSGRPGSEFVEALNDYAIKTVGSGRKVDEHFNRWQQERFFAEFVLDVAKRYNYPDQVVPILLAFVVAFIALRTRTPLFASTGLSVAIEKYIASNVRIDKKEEGEKAGEDQ